MTIPSLLPILGLLGASLALGQGGSAIITLVMPPPGSEGYAALQSGGPFAAGAASTYYNPALLADLERQTGSQLHFTRSRQDLLPVLDFPDLYNTFTGFAVALPSDRAGDDLGIGVFRSFTSFGENQRTDANGEVIGTYDSWEAVYGLGAGLRVFGPLSVGVSAKFFESALARGLSSAGDGTAYGWAFDAGFLLNPRISPPASPGTFPWLEVMPSLGASLRNLGPDIFYEDVDQSDPIPTSLDIALGLQIRLADVLEGAVAAVREAEVHRRASFDYGEVRTRGYSFKVLFFRYSRGRLEDFRGNRDEEHEAKAIEIDMRGLHRFLARVERWDWASPPSALESRYPFGRTRVFGQPFRANPRFVFGTRRIDSRDRGIRDGQDAYFVGFSL